MDSIAGLQAWYESQCNGTWEHKYGVSIESADNPGWIVKIDTIGTSLENSPFEPVAKGSQKHNVFEKEWLRCSVTGGVFLGAGNRLDEIIATFLKWAAHK
jgi:hypothetical protein